MGVDETLKIIAQWDDRGVSRGTDATAKRIEGIHRTGNRLGATFGRLGPVIIGAFSVATITQIARAGAELAALNARAELTEETFDRLARRSGSTGATEIEKLRDAVGGTLSDLRLMQSVGAAVDAGLTFEQSRTAVEFLRRYSLAFGKDFNQLVSTIFTGLQRGSTLMLDDAGIIIDASSEMFQGLGEVEKKAALVGHAIDLMREKMALLPEIQSNASTESDRLGASWEKLRISAGKFLEADVGAVMAGIGRSISFVADELERAGTLQGEAEIRQRDALRAQQDRNDAYRESHRRFWDDLGSTIENFARRINAVIAPQWLYDLLVPNRGQIDLDALQREVVRGDIDTLTPRGLPGPMTDFQIPTQQGSSGAIDIPIEIVFPPDMPEDVTLKLLGDLPLDPLHATIEISVEGDREYFYLEQLMARRGKGGDLPTASGGVYDISDLVGGTGGEQQGVPDDVDGFWGDMWDRARHELARAEGDLDLFADALYRLNPALGSVFGQINAGVQSMNVFFNATSLLGKVAGALGVGGTLFSLADSIFGWSRKAQERAQRNAQILQEQERAQAELNRSIEDAISLTGSFASSLQSLDALDLNTTLSREIRTIEQGLNRTLGLSLGYPQILSGELLGQADSIRDMIDKQFGGDERFQYLYLALNRAITISRTIEQRKTDAELAIREEQAEIIIEAIERQRRAVLDQIENSLTAQRLAATRAVGSLFDIQEAALRARYIPQFQATPSRLGQSILLDRVAQEIDTLRRGEAAALEAELNDISAAHREATYQANTFYDGTIQAIRDAIPDLSQPFVEAVEEQTAAFLSAWDAGEVSSSPVAQLPEDIRGWATTFLDDLEGRATVILDTLKPTDVKIEDPDGSSGVTVTIPPITPADEDITTSSVTINFPTLSPDATGITLLNLNLNFPTLSPGVDGITLSTINLNFPTLTPGIDSITVGGVEVALPVLTFAWPALPTFVWPAYPAWVWPALPALQVSVTGSVAVPVNVTGTGSVTPGQEDDFVDDGNYTTEEEEIEAIISASVLNDLTSNSDVRAAIEDIVKTVTGG